MKDEPFLQILDRHTAMVHARLHDEHLGLLEDLVNYGSLLLPRAYHSSQKSIAEGMILFHLAREVVIQVDALHVLLINGCVPGTSSVCRSLVEKSHLLFWSLKEDTDLKMKHLFVGGLRSALHGPKTVLTGHKEHESLSAVQKLSLQDSALEKQAKAELAKLNQRLSLPDVRSINASFDSSSAKQGYDPSWTKVYCASNSKCKNSGSARGIAKELEKLDEYQVYYADFSSATHGQDLLSSISLKGCDLIVKNIRDGAEFVNVFHLAMNSAIEVYKTLIEHYRPGEIDNFARKYTDEWWPRMPH